MKQVLILAIDIRQAAVGRFQVEDPPIDLKEVRYFKLVDNLLLIGDVLHMVIQCLQTDFEKLIITIDQLLIAIQLNNWMKIRNCIEKIMPRCNCQFDHLFVIFLEIVSKMLDEWFDDGHHLFLVRKVLFDDELTLEYFGEYLQVRCRFAFIFQALLARLRQLLIFHDLLNDLPQHPDAHLVHPLERILLLLLKQIDMLKEI